MKKYNGVDENEIIRYAHLYHMGKTENVPPAVKRMILEHQVINKFNWLPQDVAKITDDQLDLLFLMDDIEDDARHQKYQLKAFKEAHTYQ